MDATLEQPLTFGQRFQRKMAESRIFALSLLIHTSLVFLAGTIYLFKAVTDPPDFVAEGGDGLIAAPDNLPAPPETPPDAVPTETVQPTTPAINTPTLDVITTTSNTNTFKITTAAPKITLSVASSDLTKTNAAAVKGASGGVGGLPGAMSGRMGSGKARAMEQNKMKTRSEQAVMRGLEWLRQHQNPDGSWGEANKGAMTGFALLCFLGHGETNDSAQYGLTVNRAVQWIIDNGTKNQGRLSMEGSFTQPGVYSHGICTYALGEYVAMTKDERVIELFKQAIKYITDGQGPGGGWMYSYDKSEDDLSVSGWQIQALKAAHLSGLNLPGVDAALDKAMDMIDRLQGAKGGYGYRKPEDKYSTSGVGILCRLFWKGEKGKVHKGLEWVLDTTEKDKPVKYKSDHADLYAWYYDTQACLMYGGVAWTRWNKWFQDELCDVQNPDGSWPSPGGKEAPGPYHEENLTGQTYRTSLCILMLEVFYRYMPTTQG